MNNKVLVVFARQLRQQIGSQLAPLPVEVYFADTFTELTMLVRSSNVFQVVILPATLPDSETTCWELYGELSSLSAKPEVLVRVHTASFRLWSSILDAGAYDVLEEPFSSKILQNAVLHALEKFEERTSRDQIGPEQYTG